MQSTHPPAAPAEPAAAPGTPSTPTIRRRIAALPYEGLLILALALIAAFPLVGFKGAVQSGIGHFLMQLYFFAVTGAYFMWFWHQGGQTLAMKTWRFRVVDRTGARPSWGRALSRYLAALLFYGPACAGLVLLFFPARVSPLITMWMFLPMIATIWWARFDADRQFLHDRLAGTRLVSA